MKTKPYAYPEIDLKGQVALITGAAKGIGRAISLGFAQMGAQLILVDIDLKGMEKVRLEALREEAQR